jgi:hypothetical protein
MVIVMGTLEGFPNPPAMVRGEQSSPAPHAYPWSDGTSSVDLAPLALIARLAAIIPPETPAQCKAGYDNVVVPREDHVASPPKIR